MSKSRVVNSAVNTIFNFSVKLFDFGIKFVLRTVFIYTLGMQYVGVSGLFTDILSVLSFVELGIGSAITYALYKPLAENDEEKLGKLMAFLQMGIPDRCTGDSDLRSACCSIFIENCYQCAGY